MSLDMLSGAAKGLREFRSGMQGLIDPSTDQAEQTAKEVKSMDDSVYNKQFAAQNAMRYSSAPDDFLSMGMQGSQEQISPAQMFSMIQSLERDKPWQKITMAPMMRGGFNGLI